MPETESSEFEAQSQEKRHSFMAEFWDFLKHNKKWWLLPILIVLALLGLLVFLGGSGGIGVWIYPFA